MAISFYWWRKSENQKKTTDPSQVTGKLDHIKLYQYTSPWVGFKLTLTVIGTYGIYGSCKSNYSQTLNVLKFVLVSFHINDMSIWFLIAHYRIPFISRTTCEKCLDLFIFSFTNLTYHAHWPRICLQLSK